MTDYKSYLPHHRLEEERMKDERFARFAFSGLSVIGLIMLIWVLSYGCVDGVVKEVERREEFETRPVYASETYRKPAAYRLHTPTQEEMDHAEHLLVVQKGGRR